MLFIIKSKFDSHFTKDQLLELRFPCVGDDILGVHQLVVVHSLQRIFVIFFVYKLKLVDKGSVVGESSIIMLFF